MTLYTCRATVERIEITEENVQQLVDLGMDEGTLSTLVGSGLIAVVPTADPRVVTDIVTADSFDAQYVEVPDSGE